MTDEGDVMDMRGAMREFLAGEGMQELEDLLRIKEAWRGLVGEETAARTKPYRLEKGKLYVGVGSHAWAQEVHYRVEDIKTKIKEELAVDIREINVKKINLR